MTAPLELSIERRIAATPEKLWRVWTERLEESWAPKPWKTKVLAMDLRPGGRSAMIRSGPEGESSPMEGVFLEVEPARRVVLTDAFAAGWIPQKAFMVGIFEFQPEGEGTLYRASARHWDEESLKQHEAMGFETGWGIVADQLAVLAEEQGAAFEGTKSGF